MIGIYCITNIVNNKKYIGQSVDVVDRLAHHKSALRNHRHANSYLQYSWDKYGSENFTFEILTTCHEDDLDEQEQRFIRSYHTMDRRYGYNFESGGSKNKHVSAESRQKMSEKKKGKYAGANNPMYGKSIPCSEERKKMLSQKMSGSGNPMYGVHQTISDEQKQKESEMFSGAGNPFFGKHHTEDAKKKMSESHKKTPVICVETGQKYDSVNEAQRETGIHSGSIARACKRGLTAGGYHWQYIV